MIPFTLTVHLKTETMIGRWLCLDALLDVSLELQGVDMEDRDLPLAAWSADHGILTGSDATRAVRAGDACYMASAALAADPIVSHRSMVQSCRSMDRRDHIPIFNGKGAPIRSIDMKRGIAAAVLDTKRTVLTPTLTWYGTGDPDAVAALIEDLPGIGAKTSHGFGQFEKPVSCVPVGEEHHQLHGIVGASGMLLRPVPEAIFPQTGANAARAEIETTCAPYWQQNTARPAMVPVATTIRGLLAA